MLTARHLSHARSVVNERGRIPLAIVVQLRDRYLEQPHPRRLSSRHPRYVEITNRHRAAVEEAEPCYADPDSGLSVFTAAFLADRQHCCDSGCRHCPFVID